MSYYREFKPNEEAVKELRSNVYKSSLSSDSKLELYLYCMLNHSKDSMSDVISTVRCYLNSISWDAKSNEYKYAVDHYDTDKDKTIWWCGWKYSHNEPDTTLEEAFEYALSRLSEMSVVVQTPDWFDENEKYGDKAQDVKGIIEYFEDCVTVATAYEIFDKLKEFDLQKVDKEDSEEDFEEVDDENLEDVDEEKTSDNI